MQNPVNKVDPTGVFSDSPKSLGDKEGETPDYVLSDVFVSPTWMDKVRLFQWRASRWASGVSDEFYSSSAVVSMNNAAESTRNLVFSNTEKTSSAASEINNWVTDKTQPARDYCNEVSSALTDAIRIVDAAMKPYLDEQIGILNDLYTIYGTAVMLGEVLIQA